MVNQHSPGFQTIPKEECWMAAPFASKPWFLGFLLGNEKENSITPQPQSFKTSNLHQMKYDSLLQTYKDIIPSRCPYKSLPKPRTHENAVKMTVAEL